MIMIMYLFAAFWPQKQYFRNHTITVITTILRYNIDFFTVTLTLSYIIMSNIGTNSYINIICMTIYQSYYCFNKHGTMLQKYYLLGKMYHDFSLFSQNRRVLCLHYRYWSIFSRWKESKNKQEITVDKLQVERPCTIIPQIIRFGRHCLTSATNDQVLR